MEWKPIAIIVVLLLLAAVWSAKYPDTPSDRELLAAAAEELEVQCEQACAGNAGTFLLQLPANTTIYTTDEAACLRNGAALFCGRCPCELTPAERSGSNASCSFAGSPLLLQCA